VLSVVETGIPIIWSESVRDTALWLVRLATRGDRSSPWMMRAPRRRQRSAPVRLLCDVPGISPVLAGRLLEQFGSIAAVACASELELMAIQGVGKVRAASLRMALSGTFRAARSAR
jgi:ERCC4-type nuclease